MEQKPSPHKKNHKRFDVMATSSDKKGFFGFVESIMRRFRPLGFGLFMAFLFFLLVSVLGLSLAPAIAFFTWLSDYSIGLSLPSWTRPIILGLGLAVSYFIYGFSLIFIVPTFNFLLPLKLKPWTGPAYSLEVIPWYTHNALTYMARFTFLDFITPTPLNILFYRLMGMKIGKGVVLNTTFISDPCLITIEDYVTVGGSVTLFAHYAQKGLVVIKPVIIKKGATIGLKSSILGDVIVGEGETIPPHSCLLPKRRPPNSAEESQESA